MKPALALAFLLGAAACAETTEFAPAANIPATGPAGEPAAAYDIYSVPGMAPDLHATVWWEAAARVDKGTVIQLGLEIRNSASIPVQLDPNEIALDAFARNGAQLPRATLRVQGMDRRTLRIDPGEAETFHLQFRLPVRIEPDELGSMRFRWALERPDGGRFVQTTSFRRI